MNKNLPTLGMLGIMASKTVPRRTPHQQSQIDAHRINAASDAHAWRDANLLHIVGNDYNPTDTQMLYDVSRLLGMYCKSKPYPKAAGILRLQLSNFLNRKEIENPIFAQVLQLMERAENGDFIAVEFKAIKSTYDAAQITKDR